MNRRVLTLSIVLLIALVPLIVAAQTSTPRTFVPVQQGFATTGQQVLPYAPNRVLIKFTEAAAENLKPELDVQRGVPVDPETGVTSVDALSRSYGVASIGRPWIQLKNQAMASQLGVDRWYVLELPGNADIPAIVRRYQDDPNVEYVTPDWRAFPAAVPSDPLYPDHWGHNNTAQLPDLDWGGTYSHTLPNTVGTPGFDSNAQGAWDVTYGSSSVVIAILDSGVDIDHPDLTLVTGYDYGDNDSNPDDNSSVPGHGTACAGVAASNVNNGIGANGSAPNCRIMPLKVANSAGSMYFSAIVNAIYHAADNGADIISMSLGAAISSDPSTDSAILYAHNAGVTILAATGNENVSTISYPAINQYVIGVGAASPCGDRKRSSSSSSETNPGVSTDPNGYTCDGERWWGSNYGVNSIDAAGAVDILAPTILPTTDIGGGGGYTSGDYEPFFNGTSCATPYAAGVCALIKSQNPTWTPAQIRAQLVSTAIDIVNVESGSGWDRYSGYGMVDAAAALGGGGPVAPVAAFAGSPTSGEAPLSVSFTDQSSGAPTSWSWTFGDGGTSSAQNPSHNYTAAGNYTVSLTVSNAQGSDGETKVGYITVNAAGSGYATLPYSTGFESGALDQYWTTGSTGNGRVLVATGNAPHSGSYHLTMDNATSGSYSQNEAWLHLNLAGAGDVDLDFWWKDFADETHTQDGVYFSDNGGASFTKVLDLPGASYATAWNNFALDVDALAGSAGLSLTSTFVVKFQQYDNYPIATDGFAFDDISVTSPVTLPPVAAFSGDPTSGTAPLDVQFTDESTNGPTSWSWNFGDGGNATAQNPSHTYTVAGTYTVTLTASNSAGSDPETKTDYITVTDPGGGGWTTITYDDFESGWGSYSDGGADCARYTGGARAWEGVAALDIQDNSGVSSSFYHTAGYNVTGYATLEVEFYFYAYSMENNEDFWVQYYNGSSWQTVASYARGVNFNNNTFYVTTVTIPSSSYNFPTNARLRFMCDASGNADDVYIDAITWRGSATGGASSGVVVAAADPRGTSGKGGPNIQGVDELPVIRETSLAQNYPNPFNPRTTIEFSLREEAFVRLDVFNALGQRVATLVNETRAIGPHTVDFSGDRLSSGVYFYRLIAGDFVQQKKMVLLK